MLTTYNGNMETGLLFSGLKPLFNMTQNLKIIGEVPRVSTSQFTTYKGFKIEHLKGSWVTVRSRDRRFYDATKDRFILFFMTKRAKIEIDTHIAIKAAELDITEKAYIERMKYNAKKNS